MQTNPEVKAKRELTPTALILGVILAVVFGAANAYLGLRVGLTVSASVPAAVVSMAVLRFVLRRDSILENNMVQTIGSAGESLAAGAIFTLPAIYLWAEERPMEFSAPEMLSVTLIALAGGLLGVLLMVPLRRPLIVEDKALTYPEGVACADVLKAGEAGAKHARNVFVGLGVGAAVKTVTGGLKWIPENFLFPVHGIRGALGFDVSPALLGVGYIVGTKVSTLLFGGTLFGWLVLLPILAVAIPGTGSAWDVQSAQHIWKHYVRYVGVEHARKMRDLDYCLEEYVEYLGNKLVCYSVPISPGRNTAVIVETAAVNFRQKRMGYDAAKELERRVEEKMLRDRGLL